MAMKLYAPKGYVDPLTVSNKPGTFSIRTVALNLIRMELMDKDEEMDAEQSFAALEKIPMQERINQAQRRESWLLGNDEELYQMYQNHDLESLNGAKLEPAEKAYKKLYPEEGWTDEEAEKAMWEMLDENPLSQYLEENLPYESPYV